MNWKNLEQLSQLEQISQESFDCPQIIFKHSTRCNISADAYAEMNKSTLNAWFLDLLIFRNISNAIEEKYSVKHQSPQVIIIKNGKSVYTESHWNIKAATIKEQSEL